MKKDILSTATPKKQKEIVVFEINDNDREHEFKAGHKYVDEFIGFIESLGFAVSRKYEHSSSIEIQGYEFSINTDSASYRSMNVYTRERFIRKPQNRFVALEKGYQNTVCRVHINQEVDAARIRKQINAAIQKANENEKEYEDRKKKDTENTVAVGEHYGKGKYVKAYVKMISIEKGVLHFDIGTVSISLSADGSFAKASTHWPQIESFDQLKTCMEQGTLYLGWATKVMEELKTMAPISAELQEWSLKAYHRRYDMKKKKSIEH